MKLKEKKVSEALWKLFYFSVAILCISLIYTALSLNVGVVKGFDGAFFLLKLLGVILTWGVVAVVLINSIGIARDHENVVKWRKNDIKQIKESIVKVEKLLQMPEADIRKKIDESLTADVKIDGVEYQVYISTPIPIENIRGLLEKYRDSLTRQYSEKKIPAEPKIFKFWKKTLFLFLESQN